MSEEEEKKSELDCDFNILVFFLFYKYFTKFMYKKK